ncbi:MAG: DnaB-like helicase C-terminal domain-containing protein, partial [Acidimicrobiia bacterium]
GIATGAAVGSAPPAVVLAAAIAGRPAHPLAEPVAAGVAMPAGGGFAGDDRDLRGAFAGRARAVQDGERRAGGAAVGGPVDGPGAVPDPVELEVGVACGRGSAVMWDEIVAIEPDGVEQVYDLTVPELHNFVAADVFVHNTSFALGMAAHASLHASAPVLLFSLEMGSLELSQRLLCAEARIDSARVRTGRLTEDDWSRISQAIGRLASAPIWIDDNPNLTVMEIRAKARRLKSQVGDLGMVVVDYLQLMSGRANAENRQVEVSEISRGLKILARELECPVVALSQLSRQLEMRADKRPMLADLRESGCLTADARVLRADTGAEVTIGELAESGAREVPVWSLDTDLRMVPALMARAFPTGVKEVFQLRLASGHELTASANHPFLTVDGWARLDELEVGARIAVPRVLPAPKEAEHRPDGEVVRLAQRVVRSGPGDPSGDAPSVPPAVFSLTDEQVALFLRQLWAADGCVGWWDRARIHHTSSSRRVADDVRLLLLRLGIRSVVRATASPPDRSGYRVSIEGCVDQRAFVDRIGAPTRRHSAYAEVRARLSDPEPPTASPRGPDDLDAVVGPLAVSDAAWERVVAIEPRGERPVFDATVEGTHNFVANGITVENSIEQDADVVMFIYRDEVYHPDSADRGQAEIIVSKHRNGPTGLCRLAFLEQFTRFANMARV